MNRIYLQALTLVGHTGTRPVLDPLAVLLLDNRLYIINHCVDKQNDLNRNKVLS